MAFCQPIWSFLFRRHRRPSTSADDEIPEKPKAALKQNSPEDTRPPVDSPGPEAPHTAWNALKLALTTLSSVSSISSIIDPLLAIAGRIEQTATNKKGLVELAARIELLSSIVSEMVRTNPRQGQRVIQALKGELQSITEDLDAASSRGKLDQFFNSTDNASSLTKHNTILAQMIADSTLVTVHEVLKTIQDLEHSKMLQSAPLIETEGRIELGDIRGGLGATGSSDVIGGEGCEGEGPQLELTVDEIRKISNISGGTGGTGGKGDEIGGKGGTGKAPVIRRKSPGLAR
ncbi:hypothetical protein C8R44DRAFT_812238 [Mycena epipterygia]|nr:hypothetical protein C8R44DRAFT_812238 [Mycena epipterygia]